MSAQHAFQEYIDSFSAAYRTLMQKLEDEPTTWVSYEVILHRGKGKTNAWSKGGNEVLDCPEFEVAKIANAFSNEQRVRLLKAIYGGYNTFAALREQTGMNPGQLQHHLKELALTSFLIEVPQRNHYELSERGKALLLLMLCIGKWQPDVEGPERFLSPEHILIEDKK